MNIMHHIQNSLCIDQSNISHILLQLRLLAKKLNCKELNDWIKFEHEGYPTNMEPPDYRKIDVSYFAHFAGPLGMQLRNMPIPSVLIEKIAGKEQLQHICKDGISSIEDLISKPQEIYLDASNLILLLQGKIYPQCTCISVKGQIPVFTLKNIQNVVRSRILEFTIKLEESYPDVTSINFSQDTEKSTDKKEITQIVKQTIFNQKIQGNTLINSNLNNVTANISVEKKDKDSLIKYLISQRFPKDKAKELADIVASENPKNQNSPLGKKTSQWISNKLPKLSEVCKMTLSTLLKLVEKPFQNIMASNWRHLCRF